MSGDFMQDWFSLWLACTVALAPASMFVSLSKWMFGPEPGDGPVGCIAIFLLLLVVAPFLGWWCFHSFAVVWK